MRAVKVAIRPHRHLYLRKKPICEIVYYRWTYNGYYTGTGEKYEGTRIQQTISVEADPPSSLLTRLIRGLAALPHL